MRVCRSFDVLVGHGARAKEWLAGHDKAIARHARLHDIALVRYESVRDSQLGGFVAMLGATRFARPEPVVHQTWSMHVTRARIAWREDTVFGADTFEFSMGM